MEQLRKKFARIISTLCLYCVSMLLLGIVLTVAAGVAQASSYMDPKCATAGDVIVHLFEWRWDDIAQECEQFLGPSGYCGVQISPPMENAIFTTPPRPWWERYQIVSYKLQSRSGNQTALEDMIKRCHRVGVRIYADVVINHMADERYKGNGTGGSRWNGKSLAYPAVPYRKRDFDWNPSHCLLHNNQSDFYMKMKNYNCHLPLLILRRGSVKLKVVSYLNNLLALGIAGFRIDINKILANDGVLHDIVNRMTDLRRDMFGEGKRPFVYFEGIDDQEEKDFMLRRYSNRGRTMNYQYGRDLAKVLTRQISTSLLQSWGSSPPWNMQPGHKKVVFIDNHNGQRNFKKWNPLLTYKQSQLHKLATAFMLAHPYGVPRVMSSFSFEHPEQGPPRDCAGNIRHVSCGNEWECEHRWRQISNMVAFRNVANRSDVTHWWTGQGGSFAFGRGSRAFIVFYMGHRIEEHLQTGLQGGMYCDIISGNVKDGNYCTGYSLPVTNDGWMNVYNIQQRPYDQMMAIHIDSRIGPHTK